jgi:hypothetical protein
LFNQIFRARHHEYSVDGYFDCLHVGREGIP